MTGGGGCLWRNEDVHVVSEVVLISKFFKTKPRCDKKTCVSWDSRIKRTVKEGREKSKGGEEGAGG